MNNNNMGWIFAGAVVGSLVWLGFIAWAIVTVIQWLTTK